MILYEVNVTVDLDIAEKYGAWLKPHIEEILTIEGFEGALWLADEDSEGKPRWTVQYFLKDRASLDHYLANHAARMRKDATDRFGEKFKASRRVLELVESFRQG